MRVCFIRLAMLCIVLSASGHITALWGAQGQGEIGATIVNPRKMDSKELLEFCKQENHVLTCLELEDQKREAGSQDIKIYKVFTGNFE